jgi:hypothetical protein
MLGNIHKKNYFLCLSCYGHSIEWKLRRMIVYGRGSSRILSYGVFEENYLFEGNCPSKIVRFMMMVLSHINIPRGVSAVIYFPS